MLLAKGVSKKYRLGDIEVTALQGINVSIDSGEFVAIAGSSGSGKTSLLNLFGCLDSPTQGEIWVDGQNTRVLGRTALARFRSEKIGFIFQSFNLLPVLSVTENVEYPLLLQKIPVNERRQRVANALAKVGLTPFADRRPAQLSGGQQQRVAIARALVKNPKVILADEPTANLDKANAVSVLDLMEQLNRSEGITFVFSSHDPLILSRARRVVELSDGRVGVAPAPRLS